jgi:cytochrome c peroxidase
MNASNNSRLRNPRLSSIGIALAIALAASFAVARDQGDDADLLKDAQRLFQPVPKDMATAEFPVTTARVQLGRNLFFEPRVSVDGTSSCSKCHLPALYATDGLPKSVGVHGQPVPRNAPTVLNAGLYFKQHWDGRFASVEEQAKDSAQSNFPIFPKFDRVSPIWS